MPDLCGCDRGHPPEEIGRTWSKRDGNWHFYCRACIRARVSPTHYNGERCHKRGHLKTPWTWRVYRGVGRCMACHAVAGAARRRAASEARRAAKTA